MNEEERIISKLMIISVLYQYMSQCYSKGIPPAIPHSALFIISLLKQVEGYFSGDRNLSNTLRANFRLRHSKYGLAPCFYFFLVYVYSSIAYSPQNTTKHMKKKPTDFKKIKNSSAKFQLQMSLEIFSQRVMLIKFNKK